MVFMICKELTNIHLPIRSQDFLVDIYPKFHTKDTRMLLISHFESVLNLQEHQVRQENRSFKFLYSILSNLFHLCRIMAPKLQA